jgi:hypothetical protein
MEAAHTPSQNEVPHILGLVNNCSYLNLFLLLHVDSPSSFWPPIPIHCSSSSFLSYWTSSSFSLSTSYCSLDPCLSLFLSLSCLSEHRLPGCSFIGWANTLFTFLCSCITIQHFRTVCYIILVSLPPHKFLLLAMLTHCRPVFFPLYLS